MNQRNLPPLLKGGALFIDNSTGEWLGVCPRGAKYRIIDQREPSGRASALHFGGALHEALDVRYRRGGAAHDSLSEQIAAAAQALVERPVEPGDWRTPELAAKVLQQYAREYPFEDWDIVTLPSGAPAVEMPFAVPLGTLVLPEPIMLTNLQTSATDLIEQALQTNYEVPVNAVEVTEIPVVWTGKIDLVINRYGDLWLADHKSTSIFGSSYFEAFKLASQFMGYKWALEQSLPNVKIKGVMINALSFTKTHNIRFGRSFMPIEDGHVQEWRQNQLELLSQFFGRLISGYFPMHNTSCRTKWQRACDYLKVCDLVTEPERNLMLSTGEYRQVTWSPLNNND